MTPRDAQLFISSFLHAFFLSGLLFYRYIFPSSFLFQLSSMSAYGHLLIADVNAFYRRLDQIDHSRKTTGTRWIEYTCICSLDPQDWSVIIRDSRTSGTSRVTALRVMQTGARTHSAHDLQV
jgi:hypothetical protein